MVSSSFGMYCWSWDSPACDDGEAEGGGGCGGGGGAAAGWEAGEETAVAGGGLAGRGATAGFTPGVCAVAVWAAGRQMKPPESTSLSPQLSQKFVASGNAKPHRGQAWTSRVPQCLQKLAPARLGVWQLGQFITSVLSPPWVDWF